MAMEVLWTGRGEHTGWTVVLMGGRRVVRFGNKIAAKASAPKPALRYLVDAPARKARDTQQALPLDVPRRQRQPRPTTPPPPPPPPPARRGTAKKKTAPCHCPAPELLKRTARKAVLFVWFAPARTPTAKRGGSLRYIGGWPSDDAAGAMRAAKARPLPPGVLYICDGNKNIIKTATKAEGSEKC